MPVAWQLISLSITVYEINTNEGRHKRLTRLLMYTKFASKQEGKITWNRDNESFFKNSLALWLNKTEDADKYTQSKRTLFHVQKSIWEGNMYIYYTKIQTYSWEEREINNRHIYLTSFKEIYNYLKHVVVECDATFYDVRAVLQHQLCWTMQSANP